jgi:hypothetical protein
MADSNVVPFPRKRANAEPETVERITRLAQRAEVLLAGFDASSDVSDLVDIVERCSPALAEIGILLLPPEDQQEMHTVLASLATLIARRRDRLPGSYDVHGLETARAAERSDFS